MLPDMPLLLAFVGASLMLAITPGPAVVYIVARTLARGRACGLASVLGVAPEGEMDRFVIHSVLKPAIS